METTQSIISFNGDSNLRDNYYSLLVLASCQPDDLAAIVFALLPASCNVLEKDIAYTKDVIDIPNLTEMQWGIGTNGALALTVSLAPNKTNF